MTIQRHLKDLITSHKLIGGEHIVVRPVKSTDAKKLQAFINTLSSKSKHFNYMENFRELSKSALKRLTHIDYEHEMVFVATFEKADDEEIIGMTRYVTSGVEECEFDITITDKWQNKGVGTLLIKSLIEEAKFKGLRVMKGIVLASNIDMIELSKHLGFRISSSDDPTIKVITKFLQSS